MRPRLVTSYGEYLRLFGDAHGELPLTRAEKSPERWACQCRRASTLRSV